MRSASPLASSCYKRRLRICMRPWPRASPLAGSSKRNGRRPAALRMRAAGGADTFARLHCASFLMINWIVTVWKVKKRYGRQLYDWRGAKNKATRRPICTRHFYLMLLTATCRIR